MKRLVLLLCLLLVTGCHRQRKSTVNSDASRASHHIVMETDVTGEGTSCTATAVGPHALLTAAHCVIGTSSILVDGLQADVLQILYDEKDHALVLVTASFDHIAVIEERNPHPQEHVYFVGNPGKSTNVRRDGFFLKGEYEEDTVYICIFQIPTFPGDSGAGIVSNEGKVIGVVSVGNQSAETGAFPLAFTPEQIAQASK